MLVDITMISDKSKLTSCMQSGYQCIEFRTAYTAGPDEISWTTAFG